MLKKRSLILSALCLLIIGLSYADDPGPYINTFHAKWICNFAHPSRAIGPVVDSVKNGNASDPSTWSGPFIPGVTTLRVRHSVFMDLDNLDVHVLAVYSGGKLTFDTNRNIQVLVTHMYVMAEGEMNMGTDTLPIATNKKIVVTFRDRPLETGAGQDPMQFGNGLLVFGKLRVHGAVIDPTFEALTTEPLAGATNLTFGRSVSGVRVGDQVYIPDTREVFRTRELGYVSQSEIRLVTGVGSNSVSIEPLQYSHKGARDVEGHLDFLPHVAFLTRNIIFRSENYLGTVGHILATERADVDIRYARFTDLSRTRIRRLDNSVVDASGNPTHIGTNQKGRYAIHMHHCIGPDVTPPNGYQFTLVGNVIDFTIDGVAPENRQKWGITIHGSSYGLVRDNITYYAGGSGLMTEGGFGGNPAEQEDEYNNLIEHNFIADTEAFDGHHVRPNERGYDDIGWEGVNFWFRSYNNKVNDNVSYGSLWGYMFFNEGLPEVVKAPAYPGADPTVPGQSIPFDPFFTPFNGGFNRNQVIGADHGLEIWLLNTSGLSKTTGYRDDAQEALITNFVAWHCADHVFFNYASNKLTIDGITIRGDATRLRGRGFYPIDYVLKNFTIRNADVQGQILGFGGTSFSDNGGELGGTTRIINSYFRNYVNIQQGVRWTSGFVTRIPPRKLVATNVRFGPTIPGSWPSDWGPQLDYKFGPAYTTLGSEQNSAVQKDSIFVYNHNGIEGNNFQIYKLEQHPNAIVPQTTVDPAHPEIVLVFGAPEAGLRNAEAAAKYELYFDPNDPVYPVFKIRLKTDGGLAVGGFIAPCNVSGPDDTTCTNATPNSRISGYVFPITGVTNNRPTVVTAASASPNPSSLKTTNLSVLGADDGGESNLRYIWSKVSGPENVTFSPNGNNTSKNTTASFKQSGTYVLKCSIRDIEDMFVDSQVTVVVNATPTTITVNPPTASVLIGNALLFTATARDQFGYTLNPTPNFTWSVTGGGSVNSNGLFTAGPTPGGPFDLNAKSESVTGTAKVTVTATRPAPLLIIDSPLEGAVLTAGHVVVNYHVVGRFAGDEVDHVHFQLDSNPEIRDLDLDGNYTFSGVSNASHQLKGYLARSNHSQVGTVIGPIHFQVNSTINLAPSVNAGSDQTITLPGVASFHGIVEDDGLPTLGTLTVAWSMISGPGSVRFLNAVNVNTTADFSAVGEYVLRLTANDGALTATDEVSIKVLGPSGSTPASNTTQRIIDVAHGKLGVIPCEAGEVFVDVINARGHVVAENIPCVQGKVTWDCSLSNGNRGSAGVYVIGQKREKVVCIEGRKK